MGFPNPIDFYGVLLDGRAILPTNNENVGEVDDLKINAAVARLGRIPVTQLRQVAPQWQKLDEYVARKAYVAVFGYQKFPFFASDSHELLGAEDQPAVRLGLHLVPAEVVAGLTSATTAGAGRDDRAHANAATYGGIRMGECGHLRRATP